MYVAIGEAAQLKSITKANGHGTLALTVVANVPSVVSLADRIESDPRTVDDAARLLAPWLDRATIERAFYNSSQVGDITRLHTTAARERTGAEVVRRVMDRLELWLRLKRPEASRALWPYHNGLREYLLLTCFDQLGQCRDWMPVTDWLASTDERVKAERARAEIGTNASVEQSALALVEVYNREYGVKSAFRRFVRRVIGDEQRERLLASLHATRGPLPLTAGDVKPLTNSEKVDMLFDMRNAFTHQGISRTHLDPHPADPDDRDVTSVYHMGTRIERNRVVTWGVRNWPRVLEETVLDGLVSYIRQLAG